MRTEKQLAVFAAARKKRMENVAAAKLAPKANRISKQRRWQEKMVHEGRCQKCGGRIDPKSLSSCKKCLKKAKEYYYKTKLARESNANA